MLDEFDKIPYVSHLGYQNMFFVIKQEYYWAGMRKYIMEYSGRCLECQ